MFSTLHLLDHPSDQAALLDFAASLAPDLENTARGLVTLDLFALPKARLDPPRWIRETLQHARALGSGLRLSLAPTPDLAHLATHSETTAATLTSEARIKIPSTLFTPDAPAPFHATLLELPLFRLRHPLRQGFGGQEGYGATSPLSQFDIHNSQFDILSLWGLHTLGDLAALPRQGLAERLGPEIARFHDILHGKHQRLLKLHRPQPQFHVTHDLEHPLESLEPLLFLLRRTLDTLCARLAAVQRAAVVIHLTLSFDDGSQHHRDLRLPEASCQPAHLLRPLHTHLDTLTAPSPIVAYALALTPTLPSEAQHDLFLRALRDPNKFSDTLARIEALLGPDCLGTPVPLDSHHPDTFTLRNPLASDLNTSNLTLKTPTTALPLRRYRPPLPIHVASEPEGRHFRPLALLTGPHPGPIDDCHGPYLSSGQWWQRDTRWQRTEWDVQLGDGTLLRLAHLPPAEWLLEGIYA